jgi:hypothetical protein
VTADLCASELGWVAERLGLRLEIDSDVLGGRLDRMAGLALRRNPRRAHLLVSRLLGKHLPVDPCEALEAGARLAARLPAAVVQGEPLVFGFAETATALGHSVAAAVPGAVYVCSTRRPGVSSLSFEEAHSHATEHRVLAPPELIAGARPVVLVDDELSTGRTAVNTIRALHAVAPRPSYTVAALLDLRTDSSRAAFAALADELGVPVEPASLLSGRLLVPEDALASAAPLVAAGEAALAPSGEHRVERIDAVWPTALPLGGRHGWGPELEESLSTALKPLAETVGAMVTELPRPGGPSSGPRRVLVLGTEELMYVPMRLAAALAERLGDDAVVRNQSTTRSPVVALDRDGYAVRCALVFDAPDEPGRPSYVYNVAPRSSAGGLSYDAIVVVCDPPATRADGPMLAALAGCAPVIQVRLPEVSP